MEELQSDTSVVILPAEKGRSPVILNRDDYLEKRMNHINNGPYESLRKDPATNIKGKTLRQLKALKGNFWLRSYGQPKIHKPEVPLRLFVSYSGFKLYNLNKYIANFWKLMLQMKTTTLKILPRFPTIFEMFS